MQMPEPIYPELVEKIKADYQKQLDAATSDTLKATIQMQCDFAVAQEIGRQRREAIEQGGELGERIKAENDEMQKKLEAEMDPKLLAEIRKRQEELENAKKRPRFCQDCGTPISSGRFCPNCGRKLF
ncbi:MAG: hypothetical protein MJ118_03905 [Clostridia bacterium]|nr:hypothetical protein [Clostridia bacterium]